MSKQLQLVAVLIAALLALASPAQSQNHWQLIRAEYGAGNQYRDVTARVQSLVLGDLLDVRVNNDTMGVDPAPGQHKTLRLQVRGLDGDIRQLNFSEGETARVQVMKGGGYGAGLQITHAEYGAGSKTRDVTSVLAGMIQGNSLSVRVTNDAMGGDPADEHHKVLVVSYFYNGTPGRVAINEGDTLNLPDNPAGNPPNSGTLSILRAEYGAGLGVWNVTSRLNSQIQGNALTLRVTNDSMGGDPAHEVRKHLDVWYRYNNRAAHVLVDEGDTLTLPGPDSAYFQSSLQIARAQYGADYRFSDVTSSLNAQVQGNNLTLRVTNDAMGGDPAPGERKVLTVLYIYEGRPGRAFANEGDLLNIPGTLTYDENRDDDDYYGRYWPGRSASELRILRASWGANNQQTDLTARLASLVRGNRLDTPVNDATMGGDPAPGAQKYLRVVYMLRGLRYETNVPEGGTLSLP